MHVSFRMLNIIIVFLFFYAVLSQLYSYCRSLYYAWLHSYLYMYNYMYDWVYMYVPIFLI